MAIQHLNLNIRMDKLCSGPLSDKLLWITTNDQKFLSGSYLERTSEFRAKPELCTIF